MNREPIVILLVEDDTAHVAAIRRAFLDADPQAVVASVNSLREYREIAAVQPPDVAIMDLNLPDGRATDALSAPPEAGPFPIVLMTSYGNEQVAVEAMRAGALDYVVKSAETFAGMPRTVERVLREWDLMQAHRQAEVALRESEERYRVLFDRANDGTFLLSADGQLIMINESFARMHGYSVSEMRLMGLKDLDTPASSRLAPERMRRLLAGEALTFEVEHLHKDGHIFPLEVSASLISFGGNALIQCFHRDITERKRAEADVKASLCEKEALLKEIHHRVKNNLQIIISLLRLQSGHSEIPAVRSVLRDMQSRAHSMALIHEILYGSERLADVDMARYIQKLCTYLFKALVVQSDTIRMQTDMAAIRLGIDQAIPCGLLVNELVTNALKHAFPGGRTGELRIELKPVAGGPEVCLRVTDNGIGLPVDFDLARLKSLGLSLAPDLARQIGGRLDISPGPGASFAVTFTPTVP